MTKRIDKPDTDADKKVKACIDAKERKCFVVTAGAGSGKTTSLVKALAYIAKSHGPELKRRQQKVACITYTEVAVNEIWQDVGNNEMFHVSTIHSFLWSLVSPFQSDIRKWLKGKLQERLSKYRKEFAALTTRAVKRKEKLEKDIAKLEDAIPRIDQIKRFTYETGKDYSKGVLGHNDIIEMVPELMIRNELLASIVAQQYPFIFVDESQDTFKQVVAALVRVAKNSQGKFCLGFFGDPMQQIYGTGAGRITVEAGWESIDKPENFRSPQKVLAVINKIRATGDSIIQTGGRQQKVDGKVEPVQGAAHLFILPNNHEKTDNLEKVRAWLADKFSDSNWRSNDKKADVRILVIVHRMAAARLGFQALFEAFNDETLDKFKDSFSEGTSWMLKPFLNVVLPLVAAYTEDRQFDVMNLLRRYSPRFNADCAFISEATLSTVKEAVVKLTELLSSGSNSTVADVLIFAVKSKLIALDERFDEFITPEHLVATTSMTNFTDDQDEDLAPSEDAKDSQATSMVMQKYLRCASNQFWAYNTYLNDLSPYSTQHGIKGAEFERVIVVLDDEDGTHTQYSYDKLLDLEPLSKTDQENIGSQKESVLDRTRRLLYVCCSRATKDLAVVLYTNNVELARTKLQKEDFFPKNCIHDASVLNSCTMAAARI